MKRTYRGFCRGLPGIAENSSYTFSSPPVPEGKHREALPVASLVQLPWSREQPFLSGKKNMLTKESCPGKYPSWPQDSRCDTLLHARASSSLRYKPIQSLQPLASHRCTHALLLHASVALFFTTVEPKLAAVASDSKLSMLILSPLHASASSPPVFFFY